MKVRKPGALIQIGLMKVSFSDGFALKATGTITATTIMGGYSRAGSRNARRLLQYLITPLPYPLISTQVDGGSGFRDELEPPYQALEIPLLVLPPKKTKYNGCVARANGTRRYPFQPFHEGPLTLAAINQEPGNHQHPQSPSPPSWDSTGNTDAFINSSFRLPDLSYRY